MQITGKGVPGTGYSLRSWQDCKATDWIWKKAKGVVLGAFHLIYQPLLHSSGFMAIGTHFSFFFLLQILDYLHLFEGIPDNFSQF